MSLIESTYSTEKLAKIQKDKIVLNSNFNEIKNCYVIAIIGDARKGKSSFLNLLINNLTGQNKSFFKIDSGIDHCTLGIDIFKINVGGRKFIFLDCQGLNFEDSKNDSKYLLLIYSMANIIIFNEKNTLNNNIFSTLQPMAMFINSFENMNDDKNKPYLYIRIADYELDGKPTDLLNKNMEKHNDQYQNVRDSFRKLFNDILIGTTDSLDRIEKKMLKQNNYQGILDLKENNFMNVINHIWIVLTNMEKKSIDTKELVNKINKNEKIDFNKLDIYTANTQLEIKEFIEIHIDENKNLSNIIPDGSIFKYYKIDDFKKEIDSIRNEFKERFNSVPIGLWTKFNDKIKKYQDRYEERKQKNYDLGKSIVKPKEEKCIDDIKESIVDINQNQFNFENKLKKYKKEISEVDLEAFKESLNNIHSKIKEINEIVNEKFEENNKLLDKFRKDIDIDVDKFIKDRIDNLNPETSYYGDYDNYIDSLNPYQNVEIPYLNYKLADKKYYFKGSTKINKLLEEMNKYCKNSNYYYELYIEKLRNYYYGKIYDNCPRLYTDKIKFVKFPCFQQY
jgi:hypothetical protein